MLVRWLVCRAPLISARLFCARKSEYSEYSTATRIFHHLCTTCIPSNPLYSYNLRTPSMTFGRSSARFPKYSEYFITRSCFNSNIHNIRHTLRLRYGAFRNNLRKRTEAYPFVFLTFQVHYTMSPNIIPFRSTLTPNIHLYSHTSRRPLIGSSRTFAYSPFHFLSTPDTLVRISEDFYCAKLCTGTYSGIHPVPINPVFLFAPFEV
jgi:hypothetical protein